MTVSASTSKNGGAINVTRLTRQSLNNRLAAARYDSPDNTSFTTTLASMQSSLISDRTDPRVIAGSPVQNRIYREYSPRLNPIPGATHPHPPLERLPKLSNQSLAADAVPPRRPICSIAR